MFQKARDASVPLDTIERAIKRGTGELEGVIYEQITYEGYAPNGVAVLVEVLTDNRNRTGAEMRSIFTKNGGSHRRARRGGVAVRAQGRRRSSPELGRGGRPHDGRRSRPAPRTSSTRATPGASPARPTDLPAVRDGARGRPASPSSRPTSRCCRRTPIALDIGRGRQVGPAAHRRARRPRRRPGRLRQLRHPRRDPVVHLDRLTPPLGSGPDVTDRAGRRMIHGLSAS